MSVAEERDDWPEKGQRERRWFAAEEAAAAVHEAELARADPPRRPGLVTKVKQIPRAPC